MIDFERGTNPGYGLKRGNGEHATWGVGVCGWVPYIQVRPMSRRTACGGTHLRALRRSSSIRPWLAAAADEARIEAQPGMPPVIRCVAIFVPHAAPRAFYGGSRVASVAAQDNVSTRRTRT